MGIEGSYISGRIPLIKSELFLLGIIRVVDINHPGPLVSVLKEVFACNGFWPFWVLKGATYRRRISLIKSELLPLDIIRR